MIGVVDEKGEFSGDEIAFVYPDLSTALLGQFKVTIHDDGSKRIERSETHN